MTTPNSSHEERITILETRLDTILPTLATKEDIARLESKIGTLSRSKGFKMTAMDTRLERKLDAMGNRLIIRLTIANAIIAAIAVAAAKYL